jgi:radical SAM protein with 4Fe4S-binding SPASM domain
MNTKTRKYRTQEPPLSLSIELSEGCNLRCNFCGIAGIQEKQGHGYKFMKPETLESLMRQVADLGWNSRIGFAMRGDPTAHPEYARMISIVHEYRPKTTKLLLTNAGGLLRKPGPVANVMSLFDAGLTVLGLDHYTDIKFVPKVLEALSEHGRLTSGKMHKLGFMFYEYPQDPEGNPHTRRNAKTRTLVRIRDIAWTNSNDKKGNHNRLSNHAGSGAPPNESMAGKRCVLPFRQLAIHQDGEVAICCNDWRGVYRCGNVVTDGVAAVWQSAAMGAAREMLGQGKREFAPCKGCDHRSYRVGLLPDILGRGTLRKPDAQTRRDVEAALSIGPTSPPVLRPWEVEKSE